MAEGIMELIDSIPDEGPPADARDTSSPNFGRGMSTMEMYEILMPLARLVSAQTGEPVQAILQEMATDPTAISRAKRMLGMDQTTPFPNNIREPMPSENLMSKRLQDQLFSVPPSQQVIDPNALNRVTDQELNEMLRNLPPSQQFIDPNIYDNLGSPSTVPMDPVAKPTMSERLLSQMSLKD